MLNQEACAYICKKKPNAKPNLGFQLKLQHFAQKILGTVSGGPSVTKCVATRSSRRTPLQAITNLDHRTQVLPHLLLPYYYYYW